MQEPSDGIAEELERHLQLVLAAAVIAARRASATRQQSIQQATRESTQAARAVTAQIDAQRLLAAERLRPVFDAGWWQTAGAEEMADMWQQAASWQEPGEHPNEPTIFDHAAGRIRHELRDRAGLDPTQLAALAAVQELEHEHAATLAHPAGQPAEEQAGGPETTGPGDFDHPQRRNQLRARLVAAGVPEPAIEARTLADLGQAREAAEAVQTPVGAADASLASGLRSARRELRRQR